MDVVRVATDTSSSDKRVVARLGCTSVVVNTISLNQEVHNTLKVRPAYRVGSDAGRGTVCRFAAAPAAVLLLPLLLLLLLLIMLVFLFGLVIISFERGAL